jgi:hypothetical protein
VVRGEGGVLMSLMGRTRWVYGRILEGVGKFYSHTRFEVGNSTKVSLWHDLSCVNLALKDSFRGLFGIECVKDAFVASQSDFSGGFTQWNVSYARTAHDWEVDVFA